MSRNIYDDMPTGYDRRGRKGKKTGIIASLCVIVTLLAIVLFLLFSPEPESEEIISEPVIPAVQDVIAEAVIETEEASMVSEPEIIEDAISDAPEIPEELSEPEIEVLPEPIEPVEVIEQAVIEEPFIIYREIQRGDFYGSINAGPETALIEYPHQIISEETIISSYSEYSNLISFESISEGRIVLNYPALSENEGYILAEFSERLFIDLIDQALLDMKKEPVYYVMKVRGYDVNAEAGEGYIKISYPSAIASDNDVDKAIKSCSAFDSLSYEIKDDSVTFTSDKLNEIDAATIITAAESELNDYFDELYKKKVKAPAPPAPIAIQVKKEVVINEEISYKDISAKISAGESKAVISMSFDRDLQEFITGVISKLNLSADQIASITYSIDGATLYVNYPKLSEAERMDIINSLEEAIKVFVDEEEAKAAAALEAIEIEEEKAPEIIEAAEIVEPVVEEIEEVPFIEEAIVLPEPEVLVIGEMELYGKTISIEAGSTSATARYPVELITITDLLEIYEYINSLYPGYLDYATFDLSSPGILKIGYPELNEDARIAVLAEAEKIILDYIEYLEALREAETIVYGEMEIFGGTITIEAGSTSAIARYPEGLISNSELLAAYDYLYYLYSDYLDYIHFDISTPGEVRINYPELSEESRITMLDESENIVLGYLEYLESLKAAEATESEESEPERIIIPEVKIVGSMEYMGEVISVEASSTSAVVAYPSEIIKESDIESFISSIYPRYSAYLSKFSYSIPQEGIFKISYPYAESEFIIDTLSLCEIEIRSYLDNLFAKVEEPTVEEEDKIEYLMPMEGSVVRTSDEGAVIRGIPGKAVSAPISGVVVDAGRTKEKGKFIVIDHENGLKSIYYGLEEFDVRRGDRVAAGDIIGSVGKNSLIGDMSILIQIENEGQMIDPLSLI